MESNVVLVGVLFLALIIVLVACEIWKEKQGDDEWD